MFVTDAACVPKEAIGLSVASADASGVITHYGCIQNMDDVRHIINWNDGTQTVIIAAEVTWTAAAKLPWVDDVQQLAIETKEWMARNPWFNTPEFEQTTLQARAIDKQVYAAGYRLGDGKYFDELGRRLIAAGIKYSPVKPKVDWTAQGEATKLENYDHSKPISENYQSQ